MPQPLAGPAYPQLQPSFQMQQGNQLLATHGVDYNKRLLDWFQNGHAERVNQRRNRLQRQEQAEDQMIQHQEAIQLQKQEQQLAENHMHQEREIERQETIRLWQLIRIQRAAQEQLERREDKLADQAHRAARDAVGQGKDLNELVAARHTPRMPRPQRLANK
ncbi:hypothetical protein SERLADRAFT_431754 [Serpula lacrymans var. lacrymans S7.9]|uniref:Uncharacterized protein n=1 Tax=Serpula lacrymans var. lacrymans (strain S7.9) TaxID=578457 RepID=F8NDC0_SERL9|nr:uncharacterized protein SERLADRAFT_431754 [Serpula lacrymans var. lacrymans S7.9]EGO30258.1 hypothetical protein SERLADRAFT_431754 [Serpula lacrymans var. lacrymans S7.9]